jgi:hypothetical protein
MRTKHSKLLYFCVSAAASALLGTATPARSITRATAGIGCNGSGVSPVCGFTTGEEFMTKDLVGAYFDYSLASTHPWETCVLGKYTFSGTAYIDGGGNNAPSSPGYHEVLIYANNAKLYPSIFDYVWGYCGNIDPNSGDRLIGITLWNNNSQ